MESLTTRQVATTSPSRAASPRRAAASTAEAPSRANLPAQAISTEVLQEKYAKGDEKTIADVRRRVAAALAAVEAPEQREAWTAKFLAAQERGFVPAGRIAMQPATFAVIRDELR